MTCQEVNKHWDAFLSGDCPKELEDQIEAHIKSCEACSEKLSLALENQQPSINKTIESLEVELDIKKQRRILKRARWKQRFTTGIFLLGVLFGLIIIGSFLSGLYFTTGEKNKIEKVNEVLTTMTEMTSPNMTLEGMSSHISPYFTNKMESQITKRVGNDYQSPVGTLKANMFFSLVHVERKWDRSGGLDVKMHFLNPHFEDPTEVGNERIDGNWEQLEKVKDGTVAEVAITLDKNYSIKEAQQLLTGDFEVIWLAIDTGNESEDPERITPYISQLDALWGLPVVPNSNVLSGVWAQLPDNYERTEEKKWFGKVVTESYSHEIPDPEEQTFLNGIKFLQENKRWVNTYPHFYSLGKVEKELQRVQTYIEKHGVEVYGLVITGPTEEILKLKNVKQVKYISVGEIDWWNWGNSNFSGKMN